VHSFLIDSPLGPIEYALQGDGFPILVSHGAAGGFDQTLLIAAPFVADGFQLVAPSRDGYLRSPLTATTSPQSQAGKYACLLDRLGLDSCAILAVSVGGPSAIEFALQYPSRCRALVLVSSIVAPVRPAYLSILPKPLLLAFLQSSTYRFILLHAPDRILLRLLGVTSKDELRASSDPKISLALREVLLAARDPQRQRTNGALADITSTGHLPQYPFENIQMPTLAVHGSKDRFAPLRHTVQAIAAMPHGKIIEVKGAGHLCIVTHRTEVTHQITRFLRIVMN